MAEVSREFLDQFRQRAIARHSPTLIGSRAAPKIWGLLQNEFGFWLADLDALLGEAHSGGPIHPGALECGGPHSAVWLRYSAAKSPPCRRLGMPRHASPYRSTPRCRASPAGRLDRQNSELIVSWTLTPSPPLEKVATLENQPGDGDERRTPRQSVD